MDYGFGIVLMFILDGCFKVILLWFAEQLMMFGILNEQLHQLMLI